MLEVGGLRAGLRESVDSWLASRWALRWLALVSILLAGLLVAG